MPSPHAWFIYSNEKVSGPFATETVREKVASGQLAQNSYVWWKGEREWVHVATWLTQVDRIVQTASERASKPVWYVDAGKSPTGPLTEKELIDHLKTCGSLGRVRLWAVGMEKWTPLFELAEVMELLGLSRRENERAPLMGSVTVSRSNDAPQVFDVRAASISVDGMGLTGRHDLRPGDTLNLTVRSAELSETLLLNGEVAYVTSNGYAGVRFQKVTAEMHSTIVEYVRRFQAPGDDTQSDAA